eukprot:3195021-Pyramimonas_sp.AAC.1
MAHYQYLFCETRRCRYRDHTHRKQLSLRSLADSGFLGSSPRSKTSATPRWPRPRTRSRGSHRPGRTS